MPSRPDDPNLRVIGVTGAGPWPSSPAPGRADGAGDYLPLDHSPTLFSCSLIHALLQATRTGLRSVIPGAVWSMMASYPAAIASRSAAAARAATAIRRRTFSPPSAGAPRQRHQRINGDLQHHRPGAWHHLNRYRALLGKRRRHGNRIRNVRRGTSHHSDPAPRACISIPLCSRCQEVRRRRRLRRRCVSWRAPQATGPSLRPLEARRAGHANPGARGTGPERTRSTTTNRARKTVASPLRRANKRSAAARRADVYRRRPGQPGQPRTEPPPGPVAQVVAQDRVGEPGAGRPPTR